MAERKRNNMAFNAIALAVVVYVLAVELVRHI